MSKHNPRIIPRPISIAEKFNNGAQFMMDRFISGVTIILIRDRLPDNYRIYYTDRDISMFQTSPEELLCQLKDEEILFMVNDIQYASESYVHTVLHQDAMEEGYLASQIPKLHENIKIRSWVFEEINKHLKANDHQETFDDFVERAILELIRNNKNR